MYIYVYIYIYIYIYIYAHIYLARAFDSHIYNDIHINPFLY